MAAPSVDDLGRSFERYLRAGNKSPGTIETYSSRGWLHRIAVGDLETLARRGPP
jgi:hypothetical protein